jgi:hypothetical protein
LLLTRAKHITSQRAEGELSLYSLLLGRLRAVVADPPDRPPLQKVIADMEDNPAKGRRWDYRLNIARNAVEARMIDRDAKYANCTLSIANAWDAAAALRRAYSAELTIPTQRGIDSLIHLFLSDRWREFVPTFHHTVGKTDSDGQCGAIIPEKLHCGRSRPDSVTRGDCSSDSDCGIGRTFRFSQALIGQSVVWFNSPADLNRSALARWGGTLSNFLIDQDEIESAVWRTI